jgi:DNA-binding protein HU-beta
MSKGLNRGQFVKFLAKENDLSEREASAVLSMVLDGLVRAVVAEGAVSVTGFGTVVVVDRAGHTGRNPQTGETVMVPAHKVVRFRPGQNLLDLVNGVKELPESGPVVGKAPKGTFSPVKVKAAKGDGEGAGK